MIKLTLLLLFLITILNLKSQPSAHRYLDQPKVFKIEGFIKNYRPSDMNRFVTFRSYDITGRNKDTSILIDKQGKFSCKLHQPFEGDIGMIYLNRYINMYATTSQTIEVDIDERKWNSEENKPDAIHFSGASAQVSQMITEFRYLYTSHRFKNRVDMNDTSQSDKAFAGSRLQQLNEELNLLDTFISTKKISDPTYTHWARNYLLYSAGFDIAFFPFAGKRNHQMTYETLIDLLGPIRIDNSSATSCSAYYSLLSLLAGNFEIIANLNPKFQLEIEEQGNSKMLFILNQADRFTSGRAKQLMYLNVYNQNFQRAYNDCERNISRFESVIKESDLKALFITARSHDRKRFEPYNILERLASHPLGDSILSVFSRIIAKYPNKYLYLDFWGSWCSPCMHEMRLYPELISDLKTQPIAFIFFAVRTDEQKIQEIKSRYRIDGEFISLNDNDTRILNNVLQFTSYPSRFIISPGGILVSNGIVKLNSGEELNKLVEYQIRQAISHN